MGLRPIPHDWDNKNRRTCALWQMDFRRRIRGAQETGEYLLSEKLIFSAACGNSRFCRPANRVSRSRPSKQSLCEHVLAGKLTASGASGNNRFLRPINRV